MFWGLVGIIIIFVYVLFERYTLENMRNEVLHDYEVFASFWHFRREKIEDLLQVIDRKKIQEKEQYDLVGMLLKRCTRDPEDKGFCIGSECTLGMFVHALIINCNAYPILRDNKEYQMITNQLKKMHADEKELAKRYNGSVERYNVQIDHLPSSFVAYIFHYEEFYTYAYDEEDEDRIKAVF